MVVFPFLGRARLQSGTALWSPVRVIVVVVVVGDPRKGTYDKKGGGSQPGEGFLLSRDHVMGFYPKNISILLFCDATCFLHFLLC